MKKLNVYYWISTGLLFPGLGIGSIYGIAMSPASIEQFTQLGYPQYLAPFMGVARILALIAIVTPNYSRIKEWAYAGLAFDIIGAIYSLLASGRTIVDVLIPTVTLAVVVTSYILYHKRMQLLEASNNPQPL